MPTQIEHLDQELPELRKVLQDRRLAAPGAATSWPRPARRPSTRRNSTTGWQACGSSDPATLIYTSGTTGRPKGCQLTHSNLIVRDRGAPRSVLPDPAAARASGCWCSCRWRTCWPARSRSACFANKVTLGFTSDIKNLVPTFGGVQADPRGVGAAGVREGLQHRRTEGPRRRQGQDLRASGQHRHRSTARRRTPAGRGCCCKLQHALFDKLVYVKLRAALGGNCRGAISGGAPLGARLGHFFRGVGVTIYEGYGLTETSAAITVEPDRRREDRHRRKAGARQRHARSPTTASLLVKGGVVFNGYWRNEAASAEPHLGRLVPHR